MQFFLVVQVALASTQENVVHKGSDFLLKRSVTPDTQLLIRTVVTHHIDKSFGQFIAVLLVHPSLDGMHHIGTFERHNMIPSACIASVGTEEASVMQSLEGHAEVVAITVHGHLQVFYLPVSGYSVASGPEEIKSAHADMSVAGEVQVSVRSEGRKHLVSFRIDRSSHILYTTQAAAFCQCNAPNVFPA